MDEVVLWIGGAIVAGLLVGFIIAAVGRMRDRRR
jgi:uncharacterized protein involved in exopolysaccharide biosynthesis